MIWLWLAGVFIGISIILSFADALHERREWNRRISGKEDLDMVWKPTREIAEELAVIVNKDVANLGELVDIVRTLIIRVNSLERQVGEWLGDNG